MTKAFWSPVNPGDIVQLVEMVTGWAFPMYCASSLSVHEFSWDNDMATTQSRIYCYSL